MSRINIIILTILLSFASLVSRGQEEGFCCDSIPMSVIQKFKKHFPKDKMIQCEILYPGRFFGIYHGIDSNISLYTTIEDDQIETFQEITLKDIPFDIYLKSIKGYLNEPVKMPDSSDVIMNITVSFVVKNDSIKYYRVCKHVGGFVKRSDGNRYIESWTIFKNFDLAGREFKK